MSVVMNTFLPCSLWKDLNVWLSSAHRYLYQPGSKSLGQFLGEMHIMYYKEAPLNPDTSLSFWRWWCLNCFLIRYSELSCKHLRVVFFCIWSAPTQNSSGVSSGLFSGVSGFPVLGVKLSLGIRGLYFDYFSSFLLFGLAGGYLEEVDVCVGWLVAFKGKTCFAVDFPVSILPGKRVHNPFWAEQPKSFVLKALLNFTRSLQLPIHWLQLLLYRQW